jgi:hypothetical protein
MATKNLRCFIGTKILQAEPMTLGAYNNLRGWNIPADENPTRPGYLVVYPDGYKSWSPKEVFESAYRLVSADERAVLASDRSELTGKDPAPLDLSEFPVVGEPKVIGADQSETPIPFD